MTDKSKNEDEISEFSRSILKAPQMHVATLTFLSLSETHSAILHGLWLP